MLVDAEVEEGAAAADEDVQVAPVQQPPRDGLRTLTDRQHRRASIGLLLLLLVVRLMRLRLRRRGGGCGAVERGGGQLAQQRRHQPSLAQ